MNSSLNALCTILSFQKSKIYHFQKAKKKEDTIWVLFKDLGPPFLLIWNPSSINPFLFVVPGRSRIETNFVSHALHCSQRICERVAYPYSFNDYTQAASAENNGIIKEGCFRWQEDAGASGIVADDLYELKALEYTVKESEFFKVRKGNTDVFAFSFFLHLRSLLVWLFVPGLLFFFHFLSFPFTPIFVCIAFSFLGDFERLHEHVLSRNRTTPYSLMIH